MVKFAFLGAGLIAICFLLLLGSMGVVSAATVVDGNTGNPIEGATVTVEGTGLSAKTAPDGIYTITNIPIGVYTVTCTKRGYYPQSRAYVEVKSDQNTVVDFSLVQKEPWLKWPSWLSWPSLPSITPPTFVWFEEIIFAGGAVVALWLVFVWWKEEPKGKKQYVRGHSKMVPSRRTPQGKKTHIRSYLRGTSVKGRKKR